MDRGYGPQPFPPGFVEHVGHHGGPSNLAWVIFALLLALLLLSLVSLALDAYYRSQASSGAVAVLDQRYARGEITRDEYGQARTDLGAAPLPVTETPPEPPARGRRS
jgi:uncharacterized membrane protein